MLAYSVRFEFNIRDIELSTMSRTLPFVMLVKMTVFVLCKMYIGMWRYTSMIDLINLFKGVLISSTILIIMILMFHRFEGYPRSIFLIDWGFTLIFLGGSRVFIRLYLSGRSSGVLLPLTVKKRKKEKRLLIFGAGNTGEQVVRDILHNPANSNLFPVGFLDNDPLKQNKSIHGVSVIGKISDIESFEDNFDEILIAIPSATSKQMRDIVSYCDKSGKRFRTVPSISELIDGNVSLKMVRDVTVQDLLGRQEVQLSREQINSCLRGKRVLITGAGGSIGSELVRQVCSFNPQSIALVEMSELNLYHIEGEFLRQFSNIKSYSYLVDIRDHEALKRVMKEYAPEVVFHAAAYKHVPIQELNPWEAVRNNVMGTRNVLRALKGLDVERFVLVSTDKAVRPTNVMGATKRVTEQMVVCSNNYDETRFMVVRFGNVIGSSGSVIPMFQKQIEKGGPVTVTHPDVTRFFMSIPEASQLILEAGSMGNGGETFILDMGEAIKIADMAKDLIQLSGLELDRDIEIKFTGLRPGEKMYEELITQGEGIAKTEHEKILVIKGTVCDLNWIERGVDSLIDATRTFDADIIKGKLQKIVPEYVPEAGGQMTDSQSEK